MFEIQKNVLNFWLYNAYIIKDYNSFPMCFFRYYKTINHQITCVVFVKFHKFKNVTQVN